MTLDQSPLGQHIQEQMEAIEQDPGIPDDAEIGGIVTIVEIRNDEGFSNVRVRGNTPAHYVIGLLETAKTVQQAMILGGGQPPQEE